MALRSGWFSGDNFHLNRVSQVELPEDLCTEEERQTVGDANENTDPTRQQQGKMQSVNSSQLTFSFGYCFQFVFVDV